MPGADCGAPASVVLLKLLPLGPASPPKKIMAQSVPGIGRSSLSGGPGGVWLKSISDDRVYQAGRFGYNPPALAGPMETEFEVTLVSAGAVKLMVRAPSAPVIDR